MFQPETEDMLPRCAPKPSVPLDMNTAAIVRPTVPEVSILNNPPAQTEAAPQPPQQPKTYAEWKKQVLPKVSFPPAGAEVYSINGHVVGARNNGAGVLATSSMQPVNIAPVISNVQSATTQLYPLRPVTANVMPLHLAPSSTSFAPLANAPPALQMQQYRRSLEQPIYVQQQQQAHEANALHRLSIGACTATGFTHARVYASPPDHQRVDVLTICAGTQTDATLMLTDSPTQLHHKHLAHLATKNDFEQVVSLLSEMRLEQIRLLEAVDTLNCKLEQQQQQQQQSVQIIRRQQDASTQHNHTDCDDVNYERSKTNQLPPVIEDQDFGEYNGLQDAKNRCYLPVKELPAYLLESPRHPAAQSTAYQQPPQTTRTTNAAASKANVFNNKPNTEKSMLMNELALKYLPNEQLNEMLQELNITTATTSTKPTTTNSTTPLRAIENVERHPIDISNASYKYLKKYRLLPEEQAQANAQQQLSPVNSPLTAARLQPKQKEQSPYQQQSPMSPMLDLENIRRQPKLI